MKHKIVYQTWKAVPKGLLVCSMPYGSPLQWWIKLGGKKLLSVGDDGRFHKYIEDVDVTPDDLAGRIGFIAAVLPGLGIPE